MLWWASVLEDDTAYAKRPENVLSVAARAYVIPERIAVENGREKRREKKASYGGCWDVLAWKGQDYMFIESKRVRKDRMRIPQFRWFEGQGKLPCR